MTRHEPIVVQPEALVVNLSPLGFHRYGTDFLKAARSFAPNADFSPVPYYLRCRAIELAFKAFLLAREVPVSELKGHKLGHDLRNILGRAKALGIADHVDISADEEAEISKANHYYAAKGFEYYKVTKVVTGYADLPDLAVLENLASRLISALERVCLEAT